MVFQAVAKSTNRKSLVIGEITQAEAEEAAETSPMIDGEGLYLISIDNQRPTSVGEVLAKFVSMDAAQELAKFFRVTGMLEAA